MEHRCIINSDSVNFSQYHYYKSNIYLIDSIFGGQLYSPQTFVLSGVPGVGKTTFLLQICYQYKITNNIKPLYITGEQDLSMLAMQCHRIGVNLDICDNTDIDFITNIIPNYDIIIIDSLPTVTYNKTKYKLTKSQVPMFVVNKLIECAKNYNKCIGIILHSTKTGSYKGSSEIAHMVDAQFFINKKDGDLEMNIIKNRFGSTGIKKLYMDKNGYDFSDYHMIDENTINVPGIGNLKLR